MNAVLVVNALMLVNISLMGVVLFSKNPTIKTTALVLQVGTLIAQVIVAFG